MLRIYSAAVTYLFAPERYDGDGFVLRSYDVGDGRLLSEAADESYEHLRPWMPWVKRHQPIEDSERLVRQFRARYLLSEDFVIGGLVRSLVPRRACCAGGT